MKVSKKDQRTVEVGQEAGAAVTRRALLCTAAGAGAAAAASWALGTTTLPGAAGHTATPHPSPTPPAAGPPAFAGAQARARAATAYRLHPMTEYTPPRARIATPPVRDRPFLRLPGDDPGMVLTFDDGPDPRYTPDILRTLRRHDVRAMFFVVGEMVYDNRDLLRRIADDGHVIGNHTWTHPLLPKLSAAGIRDEIGRTGELIDRVLGEPPRWFRAPYGAWNGHTFRIGAELGMEPMAWSLDTLDWENGAETGRIARAVVAGAGPGVVVLSHDAGGDRRPSMAALRSYLPELLDAGYTITVPPRPRPEFPDAAD